MPTAAEWIAGARPRTLPAAVAPVLVGTGAAAQALDAWEPAGTRTLVALLAAGVALALQVGVNYANDYSDGVRGTDLERVGPLRLTASGIASPRQVKLAAFAAFGVAALLGLALVVLTGHWWLLAVGALCIVAAWYYTGGRRPYGYRGLGEVGVFVFFGLVAVLGTTYLQLGGVTWPAVLGAIGVGLLACALLMVNNLRDVPTDAVVGKKTLAVRIGDARARRAYVAMISVPVLLGVACAFASPWALLVLLLVPPVVILAITVRLGARGIALVPVLAGTGMLELGYGVLLGLGLAL
ncbi:1,4-dihydroxy-2-naphthoate polyprenyltransferase [Cellulomonas fimi]|uniref:1,4-dihydroxy-2-naphthoate octaprenyltransferase n=1 Tax=Cellulomonas fimi TaxID=1708 RepID=A0A7Y0LXX3_CELFI|nr:1,4-dihydroxy-2-naphthoate polyprenyltransferase [Cellulomonas fimi]NMR18787.1 1,4-dihydroxy-2-naphthoate polyprenyltransferase [Cellulomonas fimi]